MRFEASDPVHLCQEVMSWKIPWTLMRWRKKRMWRTWSKVAEVKFSKLPGILCGWLNKLYTMYNMYIYIIYMLYTYIALQMQKDQLAIQQNIPMSSKATEPKDWDFPFHFNGPRSSTSVIESQNRQLSFRKWLSISASVGFLLSFQDLKGHKITPDISRNLVLSAWGPGIVWLVWVIFGYPEKWDDETIIDKLLNNN